MAVVQISRIQHRRGLKNAMPESLAEGEIGFTTDTGEIFMGAPNFPRIQHRRPGGIRQEGIFPYSNIRLLTEFDVAYTLTDKVYHSGPLVRQSVNNNIIRFVQPAGITSTDQIVRIVDFFQADDGAGNMIPVDQSGARIGQIKFKNSTKPAAGATIENSDLIIDLAYWNVTGIDAADTIEVTFFPASFFYEFRLNDCDALIIDYSAHADDAWPSEGYQPNKPRRTGTLWVVADPFNVNVRDEYVELHTDIAGGTGLTFSGRIEDRSTNPAEPDPRIVLTCISTAAQEMQITFNVRRWSSRV